MDKLTMVYVTPEFVDVREVEPTLETYYEMLDCDMIEMPSRKIGDKYYDVICDEEGLLKPDPILSGFNSERCEPMIVGKLLICNVADDEGREVGLTEEDVRNILDHVAVLEYHITGSDETKRASAVNMDY